jgi:hypothetical protein
MKIYEYIYHKIIYVTKYEKLKKVFEKWVCSWYFCMKLWVINDIDTNY